MATLPQFDDPFTMPTPESQARLLKFIEASRVANSSEFPGLMLMSLLFYVDDEIWQESINDALQTLCGGRAQC